MRANHSGRRRKSRENENNRVGAAVVEFAVIAPLMILLTMGMMEVGRMVMVKQMLVNASREGARMAVLPGASSLAVIAQVQSELQGSSVNGAEVALSPAAIENLPAGTSIQVSVSVAAENVSWVPNPMFSFDKILQASTTMRRESR